MKNCFVSGLHDGARIDDVFLICTKVLRQARNGSHYIRMELRDRTGAIDAFKWDASEAAYAELPQDGFVQVRGTVNRHDGKLQINIDSFRRCAEKVDLTDFLARCEQDTGEMLSELKRLISTVANPQLKALLDHFFSDEEFVSHFTSAPAAQKVHHAYLGGLLQHSTNSARLCEVIAPLYAGIDRDLLLTGVILHDIGKIDEFSWDASIKYSSSGHMVGHIVGGAMMIADAIDSIGGFDPLLKLTLVHMILAHHGEKEFGSPKRPKSLEAMMLHYIEDLDAKINTFQQALAKPESGDPSVLWTERNWVFDRPLFRGIPQTPDAITETPSPEEASEETFDPFAEEE